MEAQTITQNKEGLKKAYQKATLDRIVANFTKINSDPMSGSSKEEAPIIEIIKNHKSLDPSLYNDFIRQVFITINSLSLNDQAKAIPDCLVALAQTLREAEHHLEPEIIQALYKKANEYLESSLRSDAFYNINGQQLVITLLRAPELNKEFITAVAERKDKLSMEIQAELLRFPEYRQEQLTKAQLKKPSFCSFLVKSDFFHKLPITLIKEIVSVTHDSVAMCRGDLYPHFFERPELKEILTVAEYDFGLVQSVNDTLQTQLGHLIRDCLATTKQLSKDEIERFNSDIISSYSTRRKETTALNDGLSNETALADDLRGDLQINIQDRDIRMRESCFDYISSLLKLRFPDRELDLSELKRGLGLADHYEQSQYPDIQQVLCPNEAYLYSILARNDYKLMLSDEQTAKFEKLRLNNPPTEITKDSIEIEYKFLKSCDQNTFNTVVKAWMTEANRKSNSLGALVLLDNFEGLEPSTKDQIIKELVQRENAKGLASPKADDWSLPKDSLAILRELAKTKPWKKIPQAIQTDIICDKADYYHSVAKNPDLKNFQAGLLQENLFKLAKDDLSIAASLIVNPDLDDSRILEDASNLELLTTADPNGAALKDLGTWFDGLCQALKAEPAQIRQQFTTYYTPQEMRARLEMAGFVKATQS